MKLRKDPTVKKSFLTLIIGLFVITAVLIGSMYILLSGTPLYKVEINKILMTNIGIMVLGIVCNGALFLYVIKGFINRLEKISFTIDRIMDGDLSYVSHYSEDEEGILSRLEFQFYQMGRRIKLNLEDVKHEKENIKSLVADISHQIKTPLASIKMFNDMLLEEQLNVQEREEFQKSIKAEVEKLEWLSNSLIKITRLEAGVIQLRKEQRDIKVTILQATNGIYLKALEKNIQINLEQIESINIPHDTKWTQEAIFNVLENAVKYTSEKGQIKVSVEKLETYIKIDIEDTGIGIGQEEIGNIFNRFYRGRSPIVVNTEGSGIGLYLSRRILEKQGGNIIASSEEGKGTIFSIFLTLQNCKDGERVL